MATAREFAPDFKPSVLDRFERLRVRDRYRLPNEPPTHHQPKSALAAQTSSSNTPNHLPSDNRTQASTDSTPQKQISFPQQSLRRTSLLQKQASVDYPTISGTSGGGGGNMMYSPHSLQQQPQTSQSMHQNMMSPQQLQPQHQLSYQDQSQLNYMNQDSSGLSNYNASNQNFGNYNQTSAQYNSGNYMGNDQKYSNSMIQTQYSQQSQYNPYNTHMQPSQLNQMSQSSPYTTNYNIGNQIDQQQGYQQQVPMQQQQPGMMQSHYQSQQYQTQQLHQQQMPNMQPPLQSNYEIESNQYQNQQSDGPGQSTLRRNSRQVNEASRPPHLGTSFSQSSIDHYDHYKRPPSRDSSVDRYARAASRMSGSRQASIDRTIGMPSANNSNTAQTTQPDIDRSVRAGSAFRGVATQSSTTGNGSIATGLGKPSPRATMTSAKPMFSSPNQPFEDVLLRQRTLGQDIIPSPREPKRTESLYTPQKPVSNVPAAVGGASGGGGFFKSGKLKVNFIVIFIVFPKYFIDFLFTASLKTN